MRVVKGGIITLEEDIVALWKRHGFEVTKERVTTAEKLAMGRTDIETVTEWRIVAKRIKKG